MKCARSCALLLSTQDRATPFESSDYLFPQNPQNLSSDSCTLIHHMAQSKGHFAQISDNKMENLAYRFLASLVGSPSWQYTISFVNKHRQTLAHLAVLFRYTALLEKLIEWGVDLDVQDLNGFTALHCAYLCKEWECVRLLRCAGVDEDLEDNLGRLPVDIYSPPTCYTRPGTPSSDGTSSSVDISSEGEEDWDHLPDAASHSGSPEASRNFTKGQPGSEAHTSAFHPRDGPLAISLSPPSSFGSNNSWVKAPEKDVPASNFSVDLTPSPPLQASHLNQHAASYHQVTSVSTGPSHLHGPTKEPVTAWHPSPGTPVSDMTSSLTLSEAGSLFPRRSYYRDSGSDTSSIYPPSHGVSPMSTPSPMPPATPLQIFCSHPQLHRPESSSSYHRTALHAALEAKIQPSPSPCRTGCRHGPQPRPLPLPSWSQTLAYLDEKVQKGDSGRKGDTHGELASPKLPLPTTSPYKGVASRNAQQGVQEGRHS